MRKEALIFLAVGLALVSLQWGGLAQEYTSVASLFEIGVGARAMGMGNAFIGLADDEAAAFYNPAGLAFFRGVGANSFFSSQFGSFSYLSFCIAFRNYGFSFLQLDSGMLEALDEDGHPIGNFHYASRAGVLSLGFSPLGIGMVGIGSKVKIYQASSYSTDGFGWSLSPAWLFTVGNFRLGFSLENLLAADVRFSNGHIEPWNRDLRLGGSFSWRNVRAAFGVENILARRGYNGAIQAQLGVEAWFDFLGIRFGIAHNQLTLGTSVAWNQVRFDYAMALHPQLPLTHRLALDVRFGIG